MAPEMGRQSEATRTEIEKGLNKIFQMLGWAAADSAFAAMSR